MTESGDTVLISRRVVLGGEIRPAALLIRDGKIASIDGDEPKGAAVTDMGDLVLMPSLADPHVHINEPGRADWEGFETATRAAAAGGITQLVDMPLNSTPATTTVAALRQKREAARGRCRVDCAFWGGVVPGNARELEGLAAAGAAGFKCFLVPSGVDDFGHVSEADLRAALPILARLNKILLVHAESPAFLHAPESAARYTDWLESRPAESEVEAIRMIVRLAREFRCRAHIVHLSAADALPFIAEARRSGAPLTVETCPHYLTFAAEDIPDGDPLFKCAPPLRSRANRELLWKALRDGLIDFVATDHSPCPPALKSRDFASAWGGIASLQLLLPATWTGARERGWRVTDIARKLTGFSSRTIAPGQDADLVAWDPDEEFTVGKLFHRHPQTPWAGRKLRGVVKRSYLRGRLIFDGAGFPGEPAGRVA